MRQSSAILAILLGAVPLAATPASPVQSSAAVEARCVRVEKNTKHVTQVSMAEASLLYSFQVGVPEPVKIIDRGRPVDFKLTITNKGTSPVMLRFSTSQRYEVVVWDDHCTEVWHWSHGQAFGPEPFSFAVQAGRDVYEPIRWQKVDDKAHRVQAGTYEARLVFLRESGKGGPLVLPPLIFDLQ